MIDPGYFARIPFLLKTVTSVLEHTFIVLQVFSDRKNTNTNLMVLIECLCASITVSGRRTQGRELG